MVAPNTIFFDVVAQAIDVDTNSAQTVPTHYALPGGNRLESRIECVYVMSIYA